MIKTIKILAILLVVFAVVALGLSVVLGVRPDPARGAVLAQPGVVEEFKKSATAVPSEKQTSPLVVQAQKLERRINPPPPPKPPEGQQANGQKAAPSVPAPPPPPKFDVIATCVNPVDPAKSYALLSQPGKGTFWVKAGDEVSRMVIKQILDGKIVDGDGREYLVPRTQRVSLLKPGSPVPPGYESYRAPASSGTAVQPAGWKPPESRTAVEATAAQSATAPPGDADAEVVAIPVAEKTATIDWIKQVMENPESMGLTREEIAQLGDLGQLLADVNSLPTRPEADAPGRTE
jgi:hypothetical protein